MRRLKLFEHTSIDGVIAPGSPGEFTDDFTNSGWMAAYRSPAGREAVAAAHGPSFDLVLGRRTYDLWAGYWPKVENNPMAERLNAATKFVATHRPESLAWGPARHLGQDAVDGVRQLKLQDGPDLIMWGSAAVAATLLQHGLVDEVVLFIYPLLLGRGKRFFSIHADPHELALVSSSTLPNGVVVSHFRHVGALATSPRG